MGINYIICAAGEGRRFRPYTRTPKPLITLKGRSMLEWSLFSLPILEKDNIVILTQDKHKVESSIGQVIRNKYPFNKISFVEINELTRGQLETTLLAKPYCDLDKSIAIYNCDTYYQSSNFLNLAQDESIEGIIPCAQTSGDSWSFCKVDENMNLIGIAEKERISPYASVGLYYFRRAALFFSEAQDYINSFNQDQEIYVAPFYQRYQEKGERIVVDEVDSFYPMGTPEQLNDFWKVDKPLFLKENPRGLLVFDLDNTITIEKSETPYSDKKPNIEFIKKMHEYKEQGFSIVLHTARRMKTCRNNEGEVIANIGRTTLEWLQKHNVPFDGIKFGKPYAENGFYIDDKAIRPSEFMKLNYEELMNTIE